MARKISYLNREEHEAVLANNKVLEEEVGDKPALIGYCPVCQHYLYTVFKKNENDHASFVMDVKCKKCGTRVLAPCSYRKVLA